VLGLWAPSRYLSLSSSHAVCVECRAASTDTNRAPAIHPQISQHLTAEALEFAGSAARDNKKHRIAHHHLQLAIQNGGELSSPSSNTSLPRSLNLFVMPLAITRGIALCHPKSSNLLGDVLVLQDGPLVMGSYHPRRRRIIKTPRRRRHIVKHSGEGRARRRTF
jgi:hypothetical protein